MSWLMVDRTCGDKANDGPDTHFGGEHQKSERLKACSDQTAEWRRQKASSRVTFDAALEEITHADRLYRRFYIHDGDSRLERWK
jgi:hypothetical protein